MGRSGNSGSGPPRAGRIRRPDHEDKVYSAFTSTSTEHGGQETTILALYTTIHHFGGIVVAPGYTDPVKFADGNPYGTSFVSGQGTAPDDTAQDAARYQGQRVVRIAAALKAGLALTGTARP